MLRVSAAIINNSDNEILICQRGPGGSCEFLWEFPGGKIEPGES
ncbi:MAG: NUDIX domain-containing protein, partial [Synergistaceae bacterium]|nr:NUDIX domain-containing protein [Synergistaceae bacterium]